MAGLWQAAEDGVGGRKLDTWLQLGWTTLQPVPPASPPLRWVLYQIASSFATGRMEGLGSQRFPCLISAGRQSLGSGLPCWGVVKRGWFGLAGRVVGRMWLGLTPCFVAEGA